MAGPHEVELRESFITEVQSVVHRLRAAADEIERRIEGPVPMDLWDLKPDHMRLARDTLHTVQGLVGNLRLDSMVAAASTVDREARR